MSYLKWAFWSLYYAIRKPGDFDSHLLAGERTRRPWWKFKPFVYRVGNAWEIYFAEDMYHTRPGVVLKADIILSDESGEAVGLKVHDDNLTNAWSDHARLCDTMTARQAVIATRKIITEKVKSLKAEIALANLGENDRVAADRIIVTLGYIESEISAEFEM